MRYGQWAFIPVTDGGLVRERPTAQLLSGQLNGVRILSTNTLNEGAVFTPQDITDENAFKSFLHDRYPLLGPDNVSSILGLYGVPDDVPPVQADSDGLQAPFSTTNSIYGFAWQQAANNLYAEATFTCPSYWLANAFAQKPAGQAWHYQYSVSPASHGNDMLPVLAGPEQTPTDVTTWAFRSAMQHAWGNFIVHGIPSLAPVRGGELASSISQAGLAGGGRWPPWMARPGEDHMLDLNMTGGVAVRSVTTLGGRNLTIVTNVQGPDPTPPLQPVFSVVEAYGWEGGRGKRCQLLADLGPWLME